MLSAMWACAQASFQSAAFSAVSAATIDRSAASMSIQVSSGRCSSTASRPGQGTGAEGAAQA